METIGTYLILLMIIGGIGLGIYAIHVLSSSKKEGKSISEPATKENTVLMGKMKFVPLSEPYKKLWDETGRTFSDFPPDIVERWTDIIIQKSFDLKTKETYEDIYHDALLNLIKEGYKYKQLYETSPKIDEVELRKYCAKKTGNLAVASELYDFLLHGRKEKQEKED